MGETKRIEDLNQPEQTSLNNDYVVIDSVNGTRRTPAAKLFATIEDARPDQSSDADIAADGTIFVKSNGSTISTVYAKQSNGTWIQIMPV